MHTFGKQLWFKLAAYAVLVSFCGQSFGVLPQAYAEVLPAYMMRPGSMVTTTAATQPCLVKGLKFVPDNPFMFEFIVDAGKSPRARLVLKDEASKLIKYFLAGLTIPEEDFWVNLSPYEADKVIPHALGTTDTGKDLISEDYVLKQLVASLTYPETPLGKKFWDKAYQRIRELYGDVDLPVNTFNKVWIMPSDASLYADKDKVFLTDVKFKVMMEEDYFAQEQQSKAASKNKTTNPRRYSGGRHKKTLTNDITTQIMKEVVLPVIEEEINKGKNFAGLRQIAYSVILAAWFKRHLRSSLIDTAGNQRTLAPISALFSGYIDKKKVKGIDTVNPALRRQMYQQYLEAYKKGVYDYVKHEYESASQKPVRRRYFSGGLVMFSRAPVFNGVRVGAPSAKELLTVRGTPRQAPQSFTTNINDMFSFQVSLRPVTETSAAAVTGVPRAQSRAQAEGSSIAADERGTVKKIPTVGTHQTQLKVLIEQALTPTHRSWKDITIAYKTNAVSSGVVDRGSKNFTLRNILRPLVATGMLIFGGYLTVFGQQVTREEISDSMRGPDFSEVTVQRPVFKNNFRDSLKGVISDSFDSQLLKACEAYWDKKGEVFYFDFSEKLDRWKDFLKSRFGYEVKGQIGIREKNNIVIYSPYVHEAVIYHELLHDRIAAKLEEDTNFLIRFFQQFEDRLPDTARGYLSDVMDRFTTDYANNVDSIDARYRDFLDSSYSTEYGVATNRQQRAYNELFVWLLQMRKYPEYNYDLRRSLTSEESKFFSIEPRGETRPKILRLLGSMSKESFNVLDNFYDYLMEDSPDTSAAAVTGVPRAQSRAQGADSPITADRAKRAADEAWDAIKIMPDVGAGKAELTTAIEQALVTKKMQHAGSLSVLYRGLESGDDRNRVIVLPSKGIGTSYNFGIDTDTGRVSWVEEQNISMVRLIRRQDREIAQGFIRFLMKRIAEAQGSAIQLDEALARQYQTVQSIDVMPSVPLLAGYFDTPGNNGGLTFTAVGNGVYEASIAAAGFERAQPIDFSRFFAQNAETTLFTISPQFTYVDAVKDVIFGAMDDFRKAWQKVRRNENDMEVWKAASETSWKIQAALRAVLEMNASVNQDTDTDAFACIGTSFLNGHPLGQLNINMPPSVLTMYSRLKPQAKKAGETLLVQCAALEQFLIRDSFSVPTVVNSDGHKVLQPAFADALLKAVKTNVVKDAGAAGGGKSGSPAEYQRAQVFSGGEKAQDMLEQWKAFNGQVYYPCADVDILGLNALINLFPNAKQFVLLDAFIKSENLMPMPNASDVNLVVKHLKKDMFDMLGWGESRFEILDENTIRIIITPDSKTQRIINRNEIEVVYKIGDYSNDTGEYGVIYVQTPGLASRLTAQPGFYEKLQSQISDNGIMLVSWDNSAMPKNSSLQSQATLLLNQYVGRWFPMAERCEVYRKQSASPLTNADIAGMTMRLLRHGGQNNYFSLSNPLTKISTWLDVLAEASNKTKKTSLEQKLQGLGLFFKNFWKAVDRYGADIERRSARGRLNKTDAQNIARTLRVWRREIEKRKADIELLKRYIADTDDMKPYAEAVFLTFDTAFKEIEEIFDSLESMRTRIIRKPRAVQLSEIMRELDTEYNEFLNAEKKERICGFENNFSGAVIPRADALLLKNAIKEIMVNAIYWAKNSGSTERVPRVDVVIARQDSGAVITIRDNGPGIDAQRLETIFSLNNSTRKPQDAAGSTDMRRSIAQMRERGYPDADIERALRAFAEKPGTGLGTTVALRAIEMMGGTMTVKSTPGTGTTFTIRLPAQTQPIIDAVVVPAGRLQPQMSSSPMQQVPLTKEIKREILDSIRPFLSVLRNKNENLAEIKRGADNLAEKIKLWHADTQDTALRVFSIYAAANGSLKTDLMMLSAMIANIQKQDSKARLYDGAGMATTKAKILGKLLFISYIVRTSAAVPANSGLKISHRFLIEKALARSVALGAPDRFSIVGVNTQTPGAVSLQSFSEAHYEEILMDLLYDLGPIDVDSAVRYKQEFDGYLRRITNQVSKPAQVRSITAEMQKRYASSNKSRFVLLPILEAEINRILTLTPYLDAGQEMATQIKYAKSIVQQFQGVSLFLDYLAKGQFPVIEFPFKDASSSASSASSGISWFTRKSQDAVLPAGLKMAAAENFNADNLRALAEAAQMPGVNADTDSVSFFDASGRFKKPIKNMFTSREKLREENGVATYKAYIDNTPYIFKEAIGDSAGNKNPLSAQAEFFKETTRITSQGILAPKGLAAGFSDVDGNILMQFIEGSNLAERYETMMVRDGPGGRSMSSGNIADKIKEWKKELKEYNLPWMFQKTGHPGDIHAGMVNFLTVARGISEGIGSAHASGWVLRDIKPENIMTGPAGITVVDYGIAHKQGPVAGGLVSGTLAFMSPQQLFSGTADFRDDVYSFAATLARLWAGDQMDKGTWNALVPLAKELKRKAFQRKQTPNRKALYEPFLRNCPLRSVILKGLQYNPKRRFQTIQDMAQAIDKSAKEYGVSWDAAQSVFVDDAGQGAVLDAQTRAALALDESRENRAGTAGSPAVNKIDTQEEFPRAPLLTLPITLRNLLDSMKGGYLAPYIAGYQAAYDNLLEARFLYPAGIGIVALMEQINAYEKAALHLQRALQSKEPLDNNAYVLRQQYLSNRLDQVRLSLRAAIDEIAGISEEGITMQPFKQELGRIKQYAAAYPDVLRGVTELEELLESYEHAWGSLFYSSRILEAMEARRAGAADTLRRVTDRLRRMADEVEIMPKQSSASPAEEERMADFVNMVLDSEAIQKAVAEGKYKDATIAAIIRDWLQLTKAGETWENSIPWSQGIGEILDDQNLRRQFDETADTLQNVLRLNDEEINAVKGSALIAFNLEKGEFERNIFTPQEKRYIELLTLIDRLDGSDRNLGDQEKEFLRAVCKDANFSDNNFEATLLKKAKGIMPFLKELAAQLTTQKFLYPLAQKLFASRQAGAIGEDGYFGHTVIRVDRDMPRNSIQARFGAEISQAVLRNLVNQKECRSVGEAFDYFFQAYLRQPLALQRNLHSGENATIDRRYPPDQRCVLPRTYFDYNGADPEYLNDEQQISYGLGVMTVRAIFSRFIDAGINVMSPSVFPEVMKIILGILGNMLHTSDKNVFTNRRDFLIEFNKLYAEVDISTLEGAAASPIAAEVQAEMAVFSRYEQEMRAAVAGRDTQTITRIIQEIQDKATEWLAPTNTHQTLRVIGNALYGASTFDVKTNNPAYGVDINNTLGGVIMSFDFGMGDEGIELAWKLIEEGKIFQKMSALMEAVGTNVEGITATVTKRDGVTEIPTVNFNHPFFGRKFSASPIPAGTTDSTGEAIVAKESKKGGIAINTNSMSMKTTGAASPLITAGGFDEIAAQFAAAQGVTFTIVRFERIRDTKALFAAAK